MTLGNWLKRWSLIVRSIYQYNKRASIYGHDTDGARIYYKVFLYHKHIIEDYHNTLCDFEFSDDGRFLIASVTLVDYDSLVIIAKEVFA